MECLDSEEAEAQAADAPPVTAQGIAESLPREITGRRAPAPVKTGG
jgi:hypothetical protein